MNDTTTKQDARPLLTRSRAELERAVIETARNMANPDACERLDVLGALHKAIDDLDEWERLRAEAAK